MKTAVSAVFLACVIFITPMAVHAQRLGFSTGALGSQSTGATPGSARKPSVPQMPPLPGPVTTPSVVSLAFPQLTLKPLDLLSKHLAPPQITFAQDLRPPVLPALPFALDPIAARSLSQMCVDPAVYRSRPALY